MSSALLQTDVYTDFQGLTELRGRARDDSEAALREVAGQFEALFLQMMLQSMRDANLGEGLMDSEHTKTYQSMYDKQIAIELSNSGGLGLAEMMVRQLSRSGDSGAHELPASEPSSPLKQATATPVQPPAPPSVPSAAPAGEATVATVESQPSSWRPDSPEEFVKTLWPHARRSARELGTRPEVLIAQAALETGWGQHMIKGSDGRHSYNLFGIKADARWQGDRVSTETVEFRDGLMRKERAYFRAYASPAESFADYAAFLKTNPRYREALNQAADAPAFTRELSAAGYATDPNYSMKINRIMDSGRLREALSGIK